MPISSESLWLGCVPAPSAGGFSPLEPFIVPKHARWTHGHFPLKDVSDSSHSSFISIEVPQFLFPFHISVLCLRKENKGKTEGKFIHIYACLAWKQLLSRSHGGDILRTAMSHVHKGPICVACGTRTRRIVASDW